MSSIQHLLVNEGRGAHWAKMSLNIPQILFKVKFQYFQNSKIWPFFETTKSGNFKFDIFFENFLILGDFTAIFAKKPVILGQKWGF